MTTGSDRIDPVLVLACNMATIPQPVEPASGYTPTHDAWNRLVKFASGETTLAEYEYDGIRRAESAHRQKQLARRRPIRLSHG